MPSHYSYPWLQRGPSHRLFKDYAVVDQNMLIVVTGASGQQGSSVASALLATGEYRVRAVGRDGKKASMQALAAAGAEIAIATYDDIDSLRTAFRGAYAIFGLTDFLQTFSYETEFAHGKNIVTAAAEVETLKHFIWSGMPDTIRLSDGKYLDMVHCRAKSAVLGYISAISPRLASITTTLQIGQYYENWPKLPVLFSPVKVRHSILFSC